MPDRCTSLLNVEACFPPCTHHDPSGGGRGAPPSRHDGEEPPPHPPRQRKTTDIKSTALNAAAINLVAADAADVVGKVRGRIRRRIKTRVAFCRSYGWEMIYYWLRLFGFARSSYQREFWTELAH